MRSFERQSLCQQTQQFVCGRHADIDKGAVKEFKTPSTMTSLAAREMIREKRYEKKPIKAPSKCQGKEADPA